MSYNKNIKKLKVKDAQMNKTLIGDTLKIELIPIKKHRLIHGDDAVQPPKPHKAPVWFQSFEERNNFRLDRIEATLQEHGEVIKGIQNTLTDHGKRIGKLENALEQQGKFNKAVTDYMKDQKSVNKEFTNYMKSHS